MRRQLIIGQLLCLAGMLLLLAFVPFMPQVTGLPRHRAAEMCVFWGAQWQLVIGMELRLRAVAATQARNLVPAGVGVLLAFAVCFISLSNLTFSSLQGAGLRIPGAHSGRLFPEEAGYLLAIPLFVSIGLQLPVRGSARKYEMTPVAIRSPRTARTVLHVLLLTFLAMFGATILLLVIDRWYVVASVVTTWMATILFLGLGIEQLAFAKSNNQVHRSHDNFHAE